MEKCYKKTTISLALSLFTTAIISDVFALFLTITGILIKYEVASIIALILNIFIYSMLIYNKSWEEGFRDPNRVKYGRMEKLILKGFVAGLLADIPYVLIYIAYLVSIIIKWHSEIMWLIMNALNLQFFTLLVALKPFPAAILIIFLPLPIVSGVSYILGYKQISISRKIVYKNKKNN